MKLGKKKKFVIAAALLFLAWMSAGQDLKTEATPFKTALQRDFASMLAEAVNRQFMPQMEGLRVGETPKLSLISRVEGILPLYGMARREMADEEKNTDSEEPVVLEDDGHSVILEYEMLEKRGMQTEENALAEEMEMQRLLQEENQAAMEAASDFIPREKRMQVDLEELRDYETLVRSFFTVDANTMVGSDQLNVDSLMSRKMSLEGDDDGPQILIYHTHSQEAFADSAPGDEGDTVVGVGEHLADILRNRYGYNVLHHTEKYDVETRDNAYGKALPELERILAQNPTIQVVIDLHRDQMPEETRLVMNLDGKPTARFMFFNGLSRTSKTGDIAYLQNDNIADNLAFSFQMKLKAEEYYPGLTRKIYLKGYRYNMHLRPRSLLVELGAQNNTVEEAMNACGPLAHLLDMVLRGE